MASSILPHLGAAGPEGSASGGFRREARLRTQHAELYPDIRPGEWHPAAVLADRVLAGWLLRGISAAVLGRLLVESHFEFRGGSRLGGEREGTRPPRKDR